MTVLPRLVAALLLSIVLAGCGDDPGAATAEDPESQPAPSQEPASVAPFLVSEGSDLVVGCFGQHGWPASVMAEGVEGVLTDDDVRAIFAEMLELTDNPMDLATFLPDGPDTEWRLLRVDGDVYEFGVGPWTAEGPGPDGYVLSAEDRADGWQWGGGGGCKVQPVLDEGHMWVELHATDLDRTVRTPQVQVNEMDCTGSRDPTPHLHEPHVVETAESVTVFWTSTPPQGGQTCPGNPTVSRPLPLEQPLGDRELLDGSTYPPSPVR